MIRNIIAYQIPHGWPYSAVEMTLFLSRRQFVGCGPMDVAATGFVPPRDEAALCEPIAGRYLLCHQHEEKLLPTSVVNEYVEIKCEELEQAQGYKPGRKQRKGLKEQVIAELLPQAFTKKRRTLAWINAERGWLIVEASSAKRAEDVLSDMRKALDVLPVQPLQTHENPIRIMREWLHDGEATGAFTIDQDCELISLGTDEGAVRYVNCYLGGEDVRMHLDGGKLPSMLGLTFDDRVSFIVTERLELRRIVLLDVVAERATQDADNAIELFDGQFTLAASEIEGALDALVGEMGGLAVKPVDGDLIDRRVKSLVDAQRVALSHARRGGRVEVGAFVPLGEAVPGAEWRKVK
jgi:recombination associated protein RdgC